ncbi:MAG: hypothetical protein KGH59_02525 [Candidatus Micrarchaeota archaeon]|nr:hypothetical protein [Candidatus Micrarchaeota archaeon]MDE1804632.1 hypothetical protein [Candidatus Micrarchaeota archaeon]MDE1846784.1 hypothetical protein [Candidatus Micrarchaeota archaeon]
MQHLLIPSKRAKLLSEKGMLKSIEKRLNCKIEVHDENQLVIEGDPYDEYNAKNVMSAFGRGFDIDQAYMLLSDEYFFTPINLKELFRSKDQITRVKGRIIGQEGKTKEYIEAVSGAKLCIYEGTVSMIGTIEQIKVANVAIQILLEGGTHKKAYRVMEKARRNLR